MQPELTAAAAEGKGADLFARVRQEQPHSHFILLIDRRPGREGERHMLAIAKASPWGRLLENLDGRPHGQVVEIRDVPQFVDIVIVPDGRPAP